MTRSRYLLAVVSIVGLYELVSTIMDFQFTSTVAHYRDGDAIGAHFATVYAITNAVSLVVQLFVTTPVLTRLGVGAGLLVLPAMAGLASGAFLAFPRLWVGSLLNTADNGFAYSIQQSAREALYVPRPPEEKYQAKAFIDVFVQRLAKGVAIALSLGITAAFVSFESHRWLSLATLTALSAWIAVARYAGRRFRELADEAGSERSAAASAAPSGPTSQRA